MRRTDEVMEVLDIELDLRTDTNTHYIVTALVDNMRQTLPARIHPAGNSYPAEYEPAQCSAALMIGEGDFAPPSDPKMLLDYVQDCDLDWVVDDESC